MSTFVNAVRNQSARTDNGMKALASTSNACVDLFFKIGASRGKNIVPDFTAAYVQNRDLASRIALWVRDARGGAGERELFRQIMSYLEDNRPELAEKLLAKVPEVVKAQQAMARAKELALMSGKELAAARSKLAESGVTQEIRQQQMVVAELEPLVNINDTASRGEQGQARQHKRDPRIHVFECHPQVRRDGAACRQSAQQQAVHAG